MSDHGNELGESGISKRLEAALAELARAREELEAIVRAELAQSPICADDTSDD